MAPSRGFTQTRFIFARHYYPRARTRTRTNAYSTFAQDVIEPSRKTQVYISRTLDPYLNLSIEHFLLQKTPADSTILFLYTNSPCVVIGRNQNPWVEVNLGLLPGTQDRSDKRNVGPVSLVRRRSGGGTVFHDEGNVNYSVICPTPAFDRDKHAQMVVRALQKLGVDQARVNERHDIVLGEEEKTTGARPLKVSGSAYKLTRLRSLHHGTCLLSSPHIATISKYLRSPAKAYIKARGVDSVSSPIANVNVPNMSFEDAVVNQFGFMYGHETPSLVMEDVMDVPEIAKGVEEMKSTDWIYLQTPQFIFSSRPTEDDPRERPTPPSWVPPAVAITFTARNGALTEFEMNTDQSPSVNVNADADVLGTKIHAITDWQDIFSRLSRPEQGISRWLNQLFGKDKLI